MSLPALLIEKVRGKTIAFLVPWRKHCVAKKGEENQPLVKADHKLLLIPYYAWAHRGTGEMDVWLARNDEALKPLPKKK